MLIQSNLNSHGTNKLDLNQLAILAANAGQPDSLHILITLGVDPNSTDSKGHSLMMLSVTQGHTANLETLYQLGVDITSQKVSKQALGTHYPSGMTLKNVEKKLIGIAKLYQSIIDTTDHDQLQKALNALTDPEKKLMSERLKHTDHFAYLTESSGYLLKQSATLSAPVRSELVNLLSA